MNDEIYECTVCAVLRVALPSRNTLAAAPQRPNVRRRRASNGTDAVAINSSSEITVLTLIRRRLRDAPVRAGTGLALAAGLVVPAPRLPAVAPDVTIV